MKPKYDWLRIRNRYTDKLMEYEPGEEEMSELDDMPIGWYNAFGEQMIDELNALLIKYNFADEYRILQIKEKFGGLRWYDNFGPKNGIQEYHILMVKYEHLSEKTCIACGAPGKLRSDSWILPYCDRHANGLLTIEEAAVKRKAEKEAKQKIENDQKQCYNICIENKGEFYGNQKQHRIFRKDVVGYGR